MRNELWQSRLSEVLNQAMKAPFVWGEQDCCLFACKAVEALTGYDPGENYRGRYDSELSALKILKKEGGVWGIAERVCRERGYQEVNQLFAQRGDICLAKVDRRETLGVCVGRGFAFAALPEGLRIISLEDHAVLRVWRIE